MKKEAKKIPATEGSGEQKMKVGQRTKRTPKELLKFKREKKIRDLAGRMNSLICASRYNLRSNESRILRLSEIKTELTFLRAIRDYEFRSPQVKKVVGSDCDGISEKVSKEDSVSENEICASRYNLRSNESSVVSEIKEELTEKVCDLGFDCDGISEKVLGAGDSESEGDSDSENEICRSPEEVKGFSYYCDPQVYAYLSKDWGSDEESDEDLIEDRDENDWGCKFVVKKRSKTVTNPKIPEKKYFKSDGSDCRSIVPVLHDPTYPVAELSKLALKTYNTIWDTEYEYVGLVKAYEQTVDGFRFWTRFKARLPGQDAINFQALTYLGGTNRKATVQFESVYPLPPSLAIRRTEQNIPERKRRGRGRGGQYPRRR